MSKFYITTAIPYVNAKPHIGHALEFVQADVIARYHKIIGDETLLLSGGDENALKNVQAAEKENIPIQKFVDKNSQLFADLAKKLNVYFDIFQKGSDLKHHVSSQKLWELCFKNGDIYKKQYTGLYCVGCELFYEKEELNEKGECFEHPGRKLEEVSEVNYFFKLSKYQDKIKQLIESNAIKIIPHERKNETLAFVKQGLKDISISRSNSRAKNWGVDVPNDKTQKMYVWFDALNIYQSGIGFPVDDKKYKKWWPADLHVIGKGILRFHAIYWPAFLLSAKLKLPKQIFVHGYLTVDGQKMSKTLGNVIDPLGIIEKYCADALRYYLLKEISPFHDGDFSEKRFKEVYNADLANRLGNLVARVAKLCETDRIDGISDNEVDKENLKNSLEKGGYSEHWNRFEFNFAIEELWREMKSLDLKISGDEPWLKSPQARSGYLKSYSKRLLSLSWYLKPFLPETAEKIEKQFKGPKITSQKPLFPRM